MGENSRILYRHLQCHHLLWAYGRVRYQEILRAPETVWYLNAWELVGDCCPAGQQSSAIPMDCREKHNQDGKCVASRVGMATCALSQKKRPRFVDYGIVYRCMHIFKLTSQRQEV